MTTYQKPGSNPITRTESAGTSIAPLGTPQERLEMLQNEVRNSGQAGLPIKFDFVKDRSGNSILVITVKGARSCQSCGWWNLSEGCQNDKCKRYSGNVQTLPEPLPE